MNVHRADQHLMNRCALYKKCRTCPIPNSSELVFPTMSAPASCKSFTTVAEKGDVKSVLRISYSTSLFVKDGEPWSIPDEHVVGAKAVQILSLMAMVTLCKGRSCLVV